MSFCSISRSCQGQMNNIFYLTFIHMLYSNKACLKDHGQIKRICVSRMVRLLNWKAFLLSIKLECKKCFYSITDFSDRKIKSYIREIFGVCAGCVGWGVPLLLLVVQNAMTCRHVLCVIIEMKLLQSSSHCVWAFVEILGPTSPPLFEIYISLWCFEFFRLIWQITRRSRRFSNWSKIKRGWKVLHP